MPIAFLFPGQGAQTVGIGKELYDSLPAAKTLFDRAGEILGYSLIDVCTNGPAERLNSTVVSQPAIFVASLAALEKLRQEQPEAEKEVIATAGLSLGEYTALVYAGAMTFEDGLRLVQKRGQAMQEASDTTPSAMASILILPQEKVEEICAKARSAGRVELANLLCPGNIAISGDKAAIEEAEKLAADMGGKAVRLAVAGAFHTEIMKPADEKLARALEQVTMQKPRVPVWSNVDAQPHTDPNEIKQLLVRQVLSPVLWEKTMRGLLAQGVTRFYEIGPGRVLAGLLKRVDRKIECVNV